MNLVAAILLSLLAPGAGQAYNGERQKAYGYAGFYLMMLALIMPFGLRLMLGSKSDPSQMAAVAMTAGFPLITLVAIIDAGGRAYETMKGKRNADGGGLKVGLIALGAIFVARIIIKLSGLPALIAGL